jgi:hypothetical protein
VTLSNGGPGARGDWYMSGGNRTGSGQSAYVGPLTPGLGRLPLWSTPATDTNQAASPVLSAGDDIFFSTGVINTAVLYGFDAGGTALAGWPFPVPTATGTGRSTACVGSDGSIYFGVGNGGALTRQGIQALNPNGTEKWYFDAPQSGSLVTADVASENGFVYCVASNSGLNEHFLYTIDAASGLQVNVANVAPAVAAGSSSGGFAIASSGTVYYHGIDKLFALSSNGVIQYSIGLPAIPSGLYYGNPVIAPDGTVFVTAGDGALYAYIDTGGGFLPNFTFGGALAGSFMRETPAIRDLGAGQYWIYIYDEGAGLLRKYDQTASLVASTGISVPQLAGSPCLGADGTVYVCTSNAVNTVMAFDGNSLAPLWTSNVGGGAASGPSLGSDGGLYVPGTTGSLLKYHD